MAAVRLRLGCVGVLLCAGAPCGCCFKASCVAASRPAVLAAGDGARPSDIEQQGSREVSLESASSSVLKSTTETGETLPAAAGGLSDEKPSSEEVASSVASHQAISAEAQSPVSVNGTSAEEEPSVLSANPSQTTSSDAQASLGNVLFLLSDLYERFSDCCVRVRYKLDGKAQVASGFFVSDKGHVLTPVIGGEDFYVETRSHRQFSAKKRGEDPVSSLCLLQTDEEPLRAVKDKSESETRSVSYFSLLHDNGYPKIGQSIVSLSCKLGGSVSPQIGYVTAFQERYFATEFPLQARKQHIQLHLAYGMQVPETAVIPLDTKTGIHTAQHVQALVHMQKVLGTQALHAGLQKRLVLVTEGGSRLEARDSRFGVRASRLTSLVSRLSPLV